MTSSLADVGVSSMSLADDCKISAIPVAANTNIAPRDRNLLLEIMFVMEFFAFFISIPCNP